MDSKQYWDKKIVAWEDSIRDKKRVPLIERAAALFRRPLLHRFEIAHEMLAPNVRGKRVLEFGCGSGFFAFDMMKNAQPQEYTGIDISPNATARASELAKEKGLGNMKFMTGDAVRMPLPQVDVVVGLGFLDYLTLEEIQELTLKLNCQYFLFSFSERRPSLLRAIHQLYLLTQNCPKHFYYTKEEIRRVLAPKFPDMQFFYDSKMSFGCIVHNLPRH